MNQEYSWEHPHQTEEEGNPGKRWLERRENRAEGASRKTVLFPHITRLKRPMDLVGRFLVAFKGAFCGSVGFKGFRGSEKVQVILSNVRFRLKGKKKARTLP